MHRIRVNHWVNMYVPTRCPCGGMVSFYHVLFCCPNCTDARQELEEQLVHLGLPLCLKSITCRHETEGWLLLVLAAELVFNCETAVYL